MRNLGKSEKMNNEEDIITIIYMNFQFSQHFFVTTIAVHSLVFFFRWLFFPSKHIKIIFKAFKLTLNINIEGKVCSNNIVQFCETERKPI